MKDTGDPTDRAPREDADLISLFFALFGGAFLLFAVAFNEVLLGYLDPEPPLSLEVIAAVRTGQVETAIIGLVLIGVSALVSGVPRLNVLVRAGTVANVTVAVLLTASAVLALELVLRPLATFYLADVPNVYEKDATLGWKLRPGAVWEHRRQRVTINSHGLRGPEVTYAKPGGVVRILFLGDGVTFGEGAESYAQALPYRVQQALGADSGAGVEAINAGVPGYATWQESAYFVNEGIRYGPDVVLLVFVPYDAVEWLRLRRFGGTDDGDIILRTTAGFPLADKSAIAYLIWKLWGSLRYDSDPVRLAALHEIFDLSFLCGDKVSPLHERGWSGTFDAIGKLHGACRSRAISFAIIILPSRYQVKKADGCTRPQELMGRYATENGIPVLDLYPVLLGAMQARGLTFDDLYLSGSDTQLSAVGTGIIAEATALFLREGGSHLALPRP